MCRSAKASCNARKDNATPPYPQASASGCSEYGTEYPLLPLTVPLDCMLCVRPHPPAATATTNQHLHQLQKQKQYEYLTPNHHPQQQQHHHYHRNVQNQQQSPSTTQPTGDSITGLSLSANAKLSTTAQHSKSYFHSTSHSKPITKRPLGNDGDDDGEPDGSNSPLPCDLATEALRDPRPIDRAPLPNLLQGILNESQRYHMQNQLLKELLDLRNEQIRKLNHDLQVG
ncbi:hypothetical protein GQX74_014164 [Glossina fuscipes]|nr:hypothetical protein GQX74_014164 [Glossina fuscipes]